MKVLLAVLTFAIIAYCFDDQDRNPASIISSLLRDAPHDNPRPPILLLPGIVSSRLIAWKKKQCIGPDINIQDIIWLNLKKLVETMTYDKHCWLDCLKLGINGSDPDNCKIRPDEGLSAIGELSPGNLYTPPATSIFTPLIKMLASELGYDVNNIIGSPYDWRLAPCQMESRDSFFTTLKFRLETTVKRHNRPAIVIAHSMGNNLFMYFCNWLEHVDKPRLGWKNWLKKHVWGYVGFAAPLLGAPSALKSVMSGHTFGLTISEAQARELLLTFASTHFLNPRRSPYADQTKTNSTISPDFKVHEFQEPVVSVKSGSGSTSVSFGLSDVENGDFFKWVGNMYRDPLLLEKYNALIDFYIKDPLRPLSNQHKRPPIKHVIMVYGVDLPTEISYSYRLQENNPNAQGNNGPITPILEETILEESCIAQPVIPNANPLNGLALVSNDPYVTKAPPKNHWMKTSSTDGTSSKRVSRLSSDDQNADTGIDDNQIIDEDQTYDDNQVANDHKNDLENDQNKQSSDSSGNNNNNNNDGICGSSSGKTLLYSISPAKSMMSSLQKKSLGESDLPHSGDTTVPYVSLSYVKTWLMDDVDESVSNTVLEYCKAAMEWGQTFLTTSLIKPILAVCINNTSNFLESNNNINNDNNNQTDDSNYETKNQKGEMVQQEKEKVHENWSEKRPAKLHKRNSESWSPLKLTSSQIDPAAELFYANHRNGDTTLVIEVSGVDHLDISKHSYVHGLVFEHLLPKVAEDLYPSEELEINNNTKNSSLLLWDEAKKYIDKIWRKNPR
eukprot:gene9603-12932_t